MTDLQITFALPHEDALNRIWGHLLVQVTTANADALTRAREDRPLTLKVSFDQSASTLEALQEGGITDARVTIAEF